MTDLLNKTGEIEEARTIFERSLAVRMRVLGEDHKKTLMTVGNLGTTYSLLGNFEKALELYERAFEGCEKTLGKLHPQTTSNMFNMASLYFYAGAYGKSEGLFA
ncbi:hypothetical protein TrLO_g2895 [Triparma laevis f. longispina]|uniref:Kinesin light chain n=1 Tax=Triparma laevis f. longispina TaxID=1714387 RepID=A0A9W7AF02_9STRA|nr:hypothetical protein TrLO_g2895 [Triparma laevis f. longispina]